LWSNDKKINPSRYQKLLNKYKKLEQESNLIKQTFRIKQNNNELFSMFNDINDKKLIIYVPENACTVCLERLLSRYWDDYLVKIKEHIIVLYKNVHLPSGIYFLAENLVEYKKVNNLKLDNHDLITIFFINQEKIIDIYLFDLELNNLFEPYLKIFYDNIIKQQQSE
jgi:hypothetical protein